MAWGRVNHFHFWVNYPLKCWFDVYYKHNVSLKQKYFKDKLLGTAASFNKIYFEKLAA